MAEEGSTFVGAPADDPAFEVLPWVVEAPLGQPVDHYAQPLSEAKALEFDAQLDAIEPAHMKAAARMHTLFAG